jgi:predicted nucleotidyltransferase
VNDPTPFRELNDVLAELVAGARAALGDAFCGAYLVGSFALGDADEHSDVDFVVVVEREPSPDEEAALQRLHARLWELSTPWAQHLEGSYVPRETLRRPEPGRPFLFLDNGARRLVRDPHCNSAYTRWSLRERGVALAGPPPEGLVAPVSDGELRAEAAERIADYAAWAHELDAQRAADPLAFSRWAQPYLVLTLCRLLRTLGEARIGSKREAAGWALRTLEPRWHPLIERALADRPDPWRRVHEPAPPDAAAETVAFADAAAAQAAGGG